MKLLLFLGYRIFRLNSVLSLIPIVGIIILTPVLTVSFFSFFHLLTIYLIILNSIGYLLSCFTYFRIHHYEKYLFYNAGLHIPASLLLIWGGQFIISITVYGLFRV